MPRAAARADEAAVRSLVLHGVRVGAAVEGHVGDVPSLPCAARRAAPSAAAVAEPKAAEEKLTIRG